MRRGWHGILTPLMLAMAISCGQDSPPKSGIAATQTTISQETKEARKEDAAEARELRLRTQLETDQLGIENAQVDKSIARLQDKPLNSIQINVARTRLTADKMAWEMDNTYAQQRTVLRRAAKRGDIPADIVDRMDAVHDRANHEVDEYLVKVHDARTQAQSSQALNKLTACLNKESAALIALAGDEIKLLESLQAKQRQP